MFFLLFFCVSFGVFYSSNRTIKGFKFRIHEAFVTEFQIQISYGENPIESLKPLTIAVMSKYKSKQKKYKIKINEALFMSEQGV